MEVVLARKKPVEISAVQFRGGRDEAIEVAKWCAGMAIQYLDEWRVEIKTLEGTMTASPGDWVIHGVAGEFYPCKPQIFVDTYDLIAGDSGLITGQM